MAAMLATLLLAAVPVAANTQYDPSPNSCQIIGDADIYGIGIRLSYYLQWASALIGLWIAPDSTNSTRAASVIVSVAVFINSFRGAADENSLMIVEWYIVWAIVFFLPLGNIPISKRAFKSGTGSVAMLLFVYAASLIFPVWMYFKGLDVGRKAGCEPVVWIYASIPAFNAQWILYSRIVAVVAVILSCIPLVGGIVLLWLGLTRWRGEAEEDGKDEDDEDSERLSIDSNDSVWASGAGRILLRLFRATTSKDESKRVWDMLAKPVATIILLASGSLAIAFTEMTIKVNNIAFPDTSIADSGQLIPLFIGAFTICSVLWEGLLRYQVRRDEARKTAGTPAPEMMQATSASTPVARHAVGTLAPLVSRNSNGSRNTADAATMV